MADFKNHIRLELIGRKREIRTLNHALESSSSKLVALYGRRRVGKTFLIRKHFDKQLVFEIAGLHRGSQAEQLDHFTKAIAGHGYVAAAFQKVGSWRSAFFLFQQYLDSLKGTKKKVIFIDELPWFYTPRSKFLMAFESFWNEYCTKRNDLLVVICGSAASWMIQKILRNKGGLHNRVSEKIRLEPFDLYETEAFLRQKGIQWTQYDIAQLYLITGGVPFYLDSVRKGESTAQFVDRTCFSPQGLLYHEYQELFHSLFDSSHHHYKVVDALANKMMGLNRSEISNKTKIASGGTLTKTLEELEESGFITSVVPYGKNKTKAQYKLSDFFVQFYHKFMSDKKQTGQKEWLLEQNKQAWKSWSGLAFERLCQRHINQIKQALKIEAIRSRTSSWQNAKAQIDLLIDRDDNIINLCEIKFYNGLFTIDKAYAQKLRTKQTEFRTQTKTHKKTTFLTMITTFGVVKNQYFNELIQSQIVLEDLFEKSPV